MFNKKSVQPAELNPDHGDADFAFGFSNHAAQSVVENLPQMIHLPTSEDSIEGLPGREIHGEIPPLNASFDDIEDGVNDAAQVRGGSSAVGGFGQHRFEIFLHWVSVRLVL